MTLQHFMPILIVLQLMVSFVTIYEIKALRSFYFYLPKYVKYLIYYHIAGLNILLIIIHVMI